jgi:hypothetical protein
MMHWHSQWHTSTVNWQKDNWQSSSLLLNRIAIQLAIRLPAIGPCNESCVS